MFLFILLIYFVVLIFIEFLFIILSKSNKNDIYNSIDIEKKNIDNNLLKEHNMISYSSNDNIEIKNFIGKLYLDNYYGFFINLNTWSLIKSNTLYEFIYPVSIKIIKIHNDIPIKYYKIKK